MPKKVAKLGLTKLPFAYCKNANSCKGFKGENQAEFNFLPYFCLQLLSTTLFLTLLPIKTALLFWPIS